jgi:hypothetical protein
MNIIDRIEFAFYYVFLTANLVLSTIKDPKLINHTLKEVVKHCFNFNIDDIYLIAFM